LGFADRAATALAALLQLPFAVAVTFPSSGYRPGNPLSLDDRKQISPASFFVLDEPSVKILGPAEVMLCVLKRPAEMQQVNNTDDVLPSHLLRWV
jgi:hypothetical protein